MIKLDGATIEGYVAELNQHKEEFLRLVAAVGTTVEKSADAWEGEASVAYQEQWTDLHPDFVKVEEVFETLAKQLIAATELHGDADGKLKQMLGY